MKKIKKYSKFKSLVLASTLFSTLLSGIQPIESHASGQVWNYGYTGGTQTFNPPYSGKYKLEVWGAQGGGRVDYSNGGKGGYSSGEIFLSQGDTLYINVGSQGENLRSSGSSSYVRGGFNGGGEGDYNGYQEAGGGGGASDIHSFSQKLIIAGGGGGSGWNGAGGAGGGMNGVNGQGGYPGAGGSQSSGGTAGPDYCYPQTSTSGYSGQGGRGASGGCGGGGGGGGGGGYFGGGGGGTSGNQLGSGGGGGSGYIGGVQNGQTIDGNQWIPSPNGESELGQSGNGYARITSLNTPPTVSVSSPSANGQYTQGNTIVISGSINDPDARGTMSVKYSIDNGSPVTISTLTDTSYNQNFNTTYTIPSNLSIGNHSIQVWGEDNEGGVGNKQNITFSVIDNVPPNFSLVQSNASLTNQSIAITASASDNQGIRRIQTPDGNWIYSNSVNYVVPQNGTYQFVAEDLSGNQTVKSVTVGNIDKNPPSLTLTADHTAWANTNVVINVTASDVGSGVKRIKLPDGSLVSASSLSYTVSVNGTYTFIDEDNVGNQTTKSIVINNIDTTPPSAPSISNNQNWTSTSPVSVNIVGGADSQSGVNRTEYKLEGSTNEGYMTYAQPFTVANEGETKITARTIDNVGNTSSEVVSYVRIDRTAPVNTSITIQLKP
ncbi:glycine rich domain-containing protein (plasmid) [Aneurinibacillus sp. Ricciae_BoGa-3]|uniref:glycine rich domain-containing protein n=1 Tax=Aneurinibacillus sp. Ricciae_BoGa-3 TaxID=3022697 RepID=UPI0023425773|nr:glycine rich domain-containing protein [Aneurinibacillus sp. Ricciae_BoGa-3]WCK57675.1 glycine rich domain-containing protein [Aneurinibacillus sp. Ricciae_BoGa-3]